MNYNFIKKNKIKPCATLKSKHNTETDMRGRTVLLWRTHIFWLLQAVYERWLLVISVHHLSAERSHVRT